MNPQRGPLFNRAGISTAFQKPIIACDTFPKIGLQIEDIFLKPQRLGVIDGGLSANVISGLVVLLDGVASKPGVVF